MNLEYLVVGIAKENREDLEAFYEKTSCAAYALALAYTKDRFFARSIVVEAYRRVIKYAYKFDTDMNAEYWLLDIVKNLSVNALCDGELMKLASEQHLDNVSLLIRNAILDTDEDRGKIIMLRTVSSLSKSEVAALLWYNKASCDGEFSRGIKQLAELQTDGCSAAYIKEQLPSHVAECLPQMLEEILSERETAVAKVSHKNYMIGDDEYALPGESKENRKQRIAVKKAEAKKKRIIVWCVVAALVCSVAAAGLIWWFVDNGKSNLDDPEDEYVIVEPQYNSRIAMAEKDGVLYYQNLADRGYLYSIDLKDGVGKPVKLCEKEADEIIIDGDFIYYRSDGNAIYRRSVSAKPGEAGEKLDALGAAIDVQGGKIYFSSSSGISRMDLDGGNVEVIYETNMATPYIKAAEDGAVYYSLGANEIKDDLSNEDVNFFRLAPTDEGYVVETLPHSGVYDFMLGGNAAYFDIVEPTFDAEKKGTGKICRVEVVEGFVKTDMMNATLLSAAFSVAGDYIYYYGCKELGVDGKPADKGVYRISTALSSDEGENGGEPVLVLSLDGENRDVSDMYVSDGYLYCYFCTGEKEKAYMKLTAYELNNDGLAENGESRVIFSAKGR